MQSEKSGLGNSAGQMTQHFQQINYKGKNDDRKNYRLKET